MNTNLQIPKSVIFAIAAAVGCFIAAIIAEPLFIKSESIIIPPPPEPPSPFFCFCFDDSGSMDENKRNDVKQAAKEFVRPRNLEKEKIGIVVFSSSSKVFLPLSHDKNQILSIIDSYSFGGGTIFTGALNDAMIQFQNDSEIEKINQDYANKCNEINEQIAKVNELIKRRQIKGSPINLLSSRTVAKIVLFFTDGQNADGQQALQKAQELREKGIKIYAISTQDGDRNYLNQMTGDPAQVYMTNDANIKDAFKQIEQTINADIANANDDFLNNVRKQNNSKSDNGSIEIIVGNSSIFQNIQVMIWSALLCIGMAILIVICQNPMMHKSLIESDAIVRIVVGGIIAGVVAGFAGNTVFQIIPVVFIGRLIGLGLLGGIIALGMTFYIANLDHKKAVIGGGLGGVLGSIGFLVFSFIGDTSGRLIGAAILGACIGAMIGLVETMYRNVWLTVIYDPRNVTQVNLGSQPVSVGSGKNDTIFINGVPASAGVFSVDGNNIRYKNSNGNLQLLEPGAKVNIGTVELIVCSKDTKFSASKFYPMKMSRAKELINV